VQELACRNPTAEAKLEAMRKADNDKIYASTGQLDGSQIDPSKGCDVRKIATGVRECFDAELWDTGWVCEAIQEIFRKTGASIVVKTQANNTVSKLEYSGASSYTRSSLLRGDSECSVLFLPTVTQCRVTAGPGLLPGAAVTSPISRGYCRARQ